MISLVDWQLCGREGWLCALHSQSDQEAEAGFCLEPTVGMHCRQAVFMPDCELTLSLQADEGEQGPMIWLACLNWSEDEAPGIAPGCLHLRTN